MTPIPSTPQPTYAELTPDCVLDAIESRGLRCDGRFTALNSYENRVFQIFLEDGEKIITKFYRPQRWSDAQILEEHAFALELAEREIPVVAPLANASGATLSTHAGFRFALFPQQRGRAPELDHDDVLTQLGRFLGRIHAVGNTRAFHARPALNPHTFGHEPLRFLLEGDWLPADLRAAYTAIATQLLAAVEQRYAEVGHINTLRAHGDCHPGNILWLDVQGSGSPYFVDLDDARSAPAVQDLWMLLSGDRAERTRQLEKLLSGYCAFNDFDIRELALIEPLRALRMLHYAAWLASRWQEPAFPAAFPWFNTQRYWQDQILHLREQLALLDEPALAPAL